MITAQPLTSTSQSRGKQLNHLYEVWRAAEGDAKERAAESLHRELLRFASRVIWLHFRGVKRHLQQEMVNDLWMAIGTFKGTSAFSSWAFSVFRNKCLLEWRYVRRSLGESLTGIDPESVRSSVDDLDSQLHIQEYLDRFSEDEARIVDKRLDGYSLRQIARELNLGSKNVIHRAIAAFPEFPV